MIEVAEITGAVVSAAVTTAMVVILPELFVVTLSEGFAIVAENVSVVPEVAARGVIGICSVSVPRDAIVVVFVQVTVVPVFAPQDHPLVVNELVGPSTFAGYVKTTV
jgi:hypothetical protein